MKIVTLMSFACELIIAHRVHTPSLSGRISGCELERGLQADQGGKMGSWEVGRQFLSIYGTLWGRRKCGSHEIRNPPFTLLERERVASSIMGSNTVATCCEWLCT